MGLSAWLDLLWPPACAACGAGGDAFCRACRPQGPFLEFEIAGLGVRALGPYEGGLRQAVLAFKGGRRDVGRSFLGLLAARFDEPLPGGVVLAGVPTTRRRRRERGFDQGAFLASGLAARLGLPAPAVLEQTAGDAQRGRSRTARLEARGRFSCERASLSAAAEVVLVDDVVTTGATLRDCAETLRRAGVLVRAAIVLARAAPGRDSPVT